MINPTSNSFNRNFPTNHQTKPFKKFKKPPLPIETPSSSSWEAHTKNLTPHRTVTSLPAKHIHNAHISQVATWAARFPRDWKCIFPARRRAKWQVEKARSLGVVLQSCWLRDVPHFRYANKKADVQFVRAASSETDNVDHFSRRVYSFEIHHVFLIEFI